MQSWLLAREGDARMFVVALGPDGQPAVHIHLVVGRRDGSALAGHLGRGEVRPTLEVMIHEAPAHLRKAKNPETGLALIRPAEGQPRG